MKKNSFKYIKLILLNAGVLFGFLFLLEIGSVITRSFLGKAYIGFLFKINSANQTLMNPCTKMINHPLLGHDHDPSNGCKVKGGKVVGSFILYDNGAEYKDSIITLGASTTDGFYQDSYGITWSNQLSSLLKNNNIKYSILNGGVGGYTSSQELLKLLISLEKLQNNKNVKLVISLNGSNELPAYKGTLWDHYHLPFWNEYHTKSIINKQYIDVSKGKRRIELFPSLMSSQKLFTKPKRKNILDKYKFPEEKSNYLPYKRSAEKWLYNVKSMNALAKASGAKYFVFLQPTLGLNPKQIPKNKNTKDYEIYKNYIGAYNYTLKEDYYTMINSLYLELKKECSKLDYCFDISNEILPTGSTYRDLRHLSESGNKNLSKVIFGHLKKYLKK